MIFSLKGWENVLFELKSERVKRRIPMNHFSIIFDILVIITNSLCYSLFCRSVFQGAAVEHHQIPDRTVFDSVCD